MTALLELRDLTVRYGPSTVLSGLSLTLGEREIVGMAGPSGSGKTTLGLAMLGLGGWNGARVSGSVRWKGQEADASELRRLRGRSIAYLPQEARPALNPYRTCGSQIADTAHDRTMVGTLLEAVGLDTSVAGQYPHRLSGGMCQRVLLAAALASEPELLVADEPTASLDPLNRNRVLELLARLRDERGMAILLISHDTDALDRICDRVVSLTREVMVEC